MVEYNLTRKIGRGFKHNVICMDCGHPARFSSSSQKHVHRDKNGLLIGSAGCKDCLKKGKECRRGVPKRVDWVVV